MPAQPSTPLDTPTRWGADLFRIASAPLQLAIAARVTVATGVPLLGGLAAGHLLAGVIGAACALLTTMADIGTTRTERVGTMAAAVLAIVAGGTIGAKLGGTTYADEAIVLAAAWVAGWVSASNPNVATVARFCAIAAAAGAGLQFSDPAVGVAAAAGGVIAIATALVTWRFSGVPIQDNLMDWRAGVRRALAGTGAGPRFALCYAAAATIALVAAVQLGVQRPYWATITVMMVMRREGLESLRLVIHYMIGTLAGIVLAAAIIALVESPFAIALIAIGFAAFVRLGLGLNPALGFTAFTVFFMVAVDLALRGAGLEAHLLWTRLYDVTVGCVVALVGTLVARAGTHRSNASGASA